MPHDELGRIRGEIKRWRRLDVAEEIDDARYEREIAPLKEALQDLDRDRECMDIPELASFLQSFGELFERTSPVEQRRFITEVFDRMVVDGEQLLELQPKPKYAGLFVADRR